jgi:hypothetical protein
LTIQHLSRDWKTQPAANEQPRLPRPSRGDIEADIWAQRSQELAAWTVAHLVNRTDVWGGYRPLHLREPGNLNGKIWTKPARKDRGWKRLTEDIIVGHYAGLDLGHLIGLHSTSPENTSRWGAVDIDWHGADSPPAEVNLAAALAWYSRLASLGFTPLLTDSNGNGGYHLLALFRDPVATPKVFAFLRWLVSDYASHGLTAPPEIFPKQPSILPGRFGNWLRLPGRHHTRNHWSHVWDGSTWLKGAAAVAFILSLRGDPPALIPIEATALESVVRLERKTDMPHPGIISGDHLTQRIRAYMARLPKLFAGQGRHCVGYTFACWLARDLNLEDRLVLNWLRQWDAGNSPPLGADVLAELLNCAHSYGLHGYGSGMGLRGHRCCPHRRHKTHTIRFTVEI